MKKLVIALAAGLLSASAAHAGKHNAAGCGLGSLVFTENVASQQVLAGTTNGTFGNQTFGITTGTLGCDASGSLKSAKAQENFARVNFRDLSREMAAGSGEYVASMSALMGCTESKAFGSYVQKNYSTLFPSADTTPEQMLETLRAGMASEPTLSGCSLI